MQFHKAYGALRLMSEMHQSTMSPRLVACVCSDKFLSPGHLMESSDLCMQEAFASHRVGNLRLSSRASWEDQRLTVEKLGLVIVDTQYLGRTIWPSVSSD